MKSISVLLLKAFAVLTYRGVNFYRFANNWIQIRILQKHKRYRILGSNNLDSSSVAIFAVYPHFMYFQNLKRMIDLLSEKNISILFVINKNKNSEELLAQLSEFRVAVMVRNNIGRDFGAYQAGIQFLEKRFESGQIVNLYLFNDSVVFPPKFSNLLEELTVDNLDWVTIFLNLEYHQHAQSFALKFSRDILNDEKFLIFWKKYFPMNDRKHAIKNGEVKLSALLRKSGHFPHVVINQHLLDQLMENNLFTTEERMIFAMNLNMSGSLREVQKINSLPEEIIRTKASKLLLESNPTHFLGTFLTRNAGAPLKLDLIRMGISTLAGVNLALVSAGLEADEIKLVNRILVSKGSRASFHGLEKIWFRFGLI